MNAERLKNLYATMFRCRMLVEKARATFGQEVHPQHAQEAAEVGAAIHLRPEDFVAPTQALFVANFIKGAPLDRIFARLRPSPGQDRFVADALKAPSESQINAATAAALSFSLSGKSPLTMAIVNSSSSAPDFWHEAVRFAARHKLPIVYVVCSADTRPENSIRLKAQEFGLPGITVDGGDVVAVYRVAEESVRRAREGHGPTLIECLLDSQKDPLGFMEDYLRQRSLWSEPWRDKLAEKFARELNAAAKPIK